MIDAALSLINEGTLIPTAQQISDRAAVGIRTFFRHFEDMEALFAAVDEQSRDYYEALFLGGDRNGTLENRLQHAVNRHAEAFESVSSLMLATHAQLWRSEVIRKSYVRGQRALRSDLDEWLPELKKIPKDQREAVDAVSSFDLWHRLRSQQGLSKKASIQIVTSLMKALIPSA
jgi:AcrR family transcriptional regulator